MAKKHDIRNYASKLNDFVIEERLRLLGMLDDIGMDEDEVWSESANVEDILENIIIDPERKFVDDIHEFEDSFDLFFCDRPDMVKELIEMLENIED